VPVALVEERCRGGMVVIGKFIGDAIEFERRDPWLHQIDKNVERFRGQPSGPAHAGKPGLTMQRYDARGAAGFGFGIDIGGHRGTPLRRQK
jgi:hypothetical protein